MITQKRENYCISFFRYTEHSEHIRRHSHKTISYRRPADKAGGYRMNDNRLVNIARRIRRPRNTVGTSNPRPKRRWPLWLSLGLVALILAGLGASYMRQGNMAMAPGISGIVDSNYNAIVPAKEAVSRVDGSVTSKSVDPAQPQAKIDQTQPQPWDRMIIRTATLQMQVESVGASMDKVRLVAAARGGYVTQSESRQEGEHLYATLTI